MENEPSTWEQAARIVEAYSAGVSEEVQTLLGQIAQTLRDEAVDD